MFIRARAFAVHVFTAAGAALALAALIYAVRGQWPAMFLCLGIALIVDGVDGSIARWLKVAEVLQPPAGCCRSRSRCRRASWSWSRARFISPTGR